MGVIDVFKLCMILMKLTLLQGDKNHTKTIKLGVLIPWTKDWEFGPKIGGAIVAGLEEVSLYFFY